jgi:hypothetical protein
MIMMRVAGRAGSMVMSGRPGEVETVKLGCVGSQVAALNALRRPGMPVPDELTLEVARALEVDWQYVEGVEAWDAERIAQVRSAGRKAGRLLGFKIATFQSRPNDEDRVAVIVAVREAPNAEDAQRMQERARLLINEQWSKLFPAPGEQA